jgi:hypothetical protein
MRRRSFVLVATLVVAAVTCAVAASVLARPDSRPPAASLPGFEVLALVDGSWTPVGNLAFGPSYREAVLLLPASALASLPVRVRLVQRGGGAAHVDRVALGTTAPTVLVGAPEPEALALVLRRDDDVLDASGRTLELSFPDPFPEGALRLAARVEPERIPGSPFAFPSANTFREVTSASASYPFRPAPEGVAPSWPEELGTSRPLFAEACSPATGHPRGVAYGWVANDRDTLYAAVDFTPDNTRDGAADWASLSVLSGDGVKEFRVSERETRWGRPLFLATPRAPWRHKLYLFEVPFSELGTAGAKEAGELRLVFAAYGTAAPSWLLPPFHDFGQVEVDTTSSQQTFTISNGTPVDMVLGTPWFVRLGPDSGAFPLDPGTCGSGVTLPPGGSCAFRVAFRPAASGAALDDLVLSASFGAAPSTAPLRVVGTGFSTAVPALGTIGLALLALVLGAAGLLVLRRG